MDDDNPIVFVLVAHADGTARQLYGAEACRPWAVLSAEQGVLQFIRGWQPRQIAWEDGRDSYRSVITARLAASRGAL